MRRDLSAFLLVQSVTTSRIVAAILISALQEAGAPVILGLYTFALTTDFIDGFLARRLGVSSMLGHVLDLIADKLLTAVSLLYAASLGVPLLPLAVIALRDLIMLGMRAVRDRTGPLFPTSRWLGAMLLTGVVVTTATMASTGNPQINRICAGLYWLLGAIAMGNIVWRVGLVAQKLSRSGLASSGIAFGVK